MQNLSVLKFGILALGVILLGGCYQNACGISSSYWDEKAIIMTRKEIIARNVQTI